MESVYYISTYQHVALIMELVATYPNLDNNSFDLGRFFDKINFYVLCFLFGVNAICKTLKIGTREKKWSYIRYIIQSPSRESSFLNSYYIGLAEFFTNDMSIVISDFYTIINSYTIKPTVVRNSGTDSYHRCVGRVRNYFVLYTHKLFFRDIINSGIEGLIFNPKILKQPRLKQFKLFKCSLSLYLILVKRGSYSISCNIYLEIPFIRKSLFSFHFPHEQQKFLLNMVVRIADTELIESVTFVLMNLYGIGYDCLSSKESYERANVRHSVRSSSRDNFAFTEVD
ncbi:hypothetical protein H8356DRAFT_1434721 [Neocallimastix lanati (nom. inval.)]|nr:hypothetical protein H8356DRAFT_1434721 [Neocallimastix sp. JGI-2020a]